ncbi:hypothetical protein JB92DRAFT_3120694 [Gautieria morchelliformis]|nr:hypothetical protein JB92DRAFT_3120694 [Gautieria morchelliformis]
MHETASNFFNKTESTFRSVEAQLPTPPSQHRTRETTVPVVVDLHMVECIVGRVESSAGMSRELLTTVVTLPGLFSWNQKSSFNSLVNVELEREEREAEKKREELKEKCRLAQECKDAGDKKREEDEARKAKEAEEEREKQRKAEAEEEERKAWEAEEEARRAQEGEEEAWEAEKKAREEEAKKAEVATHARLRQRLDDMIKEFRERQASVSQEIRIPSPEFRARERSQVKAKPKATGAKKRKVMEEESEEEEEFPCDNCDRRKVHCSFTEGKRKRRVGAGTEVLAARAPRPTPVKPTGVKPSGEIKAGPSGSGSGKGSRLPTEARWPKLTGLSGDQASAAIRELLAQQNALFEHMHDMLQGILEFAKRTHWQNSRLSKWVQWWTGAAEEAGVWGSGLGADWEGFSLGSENGGGDVGDAGNGGSDAGSGNDDRMDADGDATMREDLSGDTLFSISSSDTTPSSDSISDSASGSDSISASAFGNDSASGRTSTSSVRLASSTPISDFHSWNSVGNQATRIIGGIKG